MVWCTELRISLWTLPLLLSSCANLGIAQRAIEQQTPTVRAINGGSAELLLEACPMNGSAAAMEAAMQRLVTTLQYSGVIVVGDGGNAKIAINLCGGGS